MYWQERDCLLAVSVHCFGRTRAYRIIIQMTFLREHSAEIKPILPAVQLSGRLTLMASLDEMACRWQKNTNLPSWKIIYHAEKSLLILHHASMTIIISNIQVWHKTQKQYGTVPIKHFQLTQSVQSQKCKNNLCKLHAWTKCTKPVSSPLTSDQPNTTAPRFQLKCPIKPKLGRLMLLSNSSSQSCPIYYCSQYPVHILISPVIAAIKHAAALFTITETLIRISDINGVKMTNRRILP